MDRRAALAAFGGLGLSLALNAAARAERVVIVDAKDTVWQEHQDREARLRRIAQQFAIFPEPEFYEEVVPAARAPAGFPVDIPVLRVVFAEKSFFDTAQSRLRPEAFPILSAIAQMLRGDVPDTAVFVAGHTDARGSEAYNYALSVSRAEAVAQALHAQNVGEVALWRVGFGKAVPLYPNDTPEHMAYNRRVEFLFAARTEAVVDRLSRQLDHVCVASDPSATERCKRSLDLHGSFWAVQLTARQTRLDLPPDKLESLGGRAPVAAGLSAGRRSAGLGASRTTLAGGKPLATAELGARVTTLPGLRAIQIRLDTPTR